MAFPVLFIKLFVAPTASESVLAQKASLFMPGFSKGTNHPTSSHCWYPMACPLILWFLTMKPRHGTWGRNLTQLPCSKHCLNWEEEGITANINLLAQMQSLHLSELAQKHSVIPCWKAAEDGYVLIVQIISYTWKWKAIQGLNRVCGFRADPVLLGPSDLFLFWESIQCYNLSKRETKKDQHYMVLILFLIETSRYTDDWRKGYWVALPFWF